MSNRTNKVLVMIPPRISHEEGSRHLRSEAVSGGEAVSGERKVAQKTW
jgi:hypothetical protein